MKVSLRHVVITTLGAGVPVLLAALDAAPVLSLKVLGAAAVSAVVTAVAAAMKGAEA
jgi:hypothetical protein